MLFPFAVFSDGFHEMLSASTAYLQNIENLGWGEILMFVMRF